MNSLLQEISLLVEDFGSAPKLEEMPKRTLADKGIAGCAEYQCTVIIFRIFH